MSITVVLLILLSILNDKNNNRGVAYDSSL